ncbi:hypothetical protein MCU_00427 [Bartonella elizabethae Re6043vi]|uniref:Uncharacterized protein n=2 Tax=Bartonella elizabethae TaxID=807 RepID=J1KD03_BAREL|nr:hypothetical protein MCU_00427 [Bartonella elizabethae Re6043vi]EJF95717.1 hypothetical protein MEE_00954 [Bartonella elizabethae F9251 = ATCC 49927]VEJ41310.1 Uncharacterised protein [Bartonella elizabethae]
MVYAKDKMIWRSQLLPRSSDMDGAIKILIMIRVVLGNLEIYL